MDDASNCKKNEYMSVSYLSQDDHSYKICV